MTKYTIFLSIFILSSFSTIAQSNITVISPNGGESWARGLTYPISWNDTFAEDVKIELFKGGLYHSQIEASTPSDGDINWDIPGSISVGSDYKIKISSVSDSTIFDFSDANFSIGSFEITVPNGGESWAAGSFHQIKFNDDIPNNNTVVDFELWKGGVIDRVLFLNQEPDGSKDWPIPTDLPAGSDYRIKIIHSDDPTDFDFSDADFTIFPSVISISSPNGGESWQAGTAQTITWTDNIIDDVKIELFKSGSFHLVIESSTNSDGAKSWSIPFLLESGSDYTVKITSVDNSEIFDFSDSSFTIVSNQITVTSPNGGESWQAGSTLPITWTDNISEDVRIELFKSGSFHLVLESSTNSDGTWNWTLPFLESGSDYTIKIRHVDYSEIFDFSDSSFTIIGNQITVTSPNGGEDWLTDSFQNITWSNNLAGDIKIQLFKSGVYHSLITGSTESDSSYIWHVSSSVEQGSDYKIKILSTIDGSVFDFSDADFTLTNEIEVTSPNGGEMWQAGTEQHITWTDNISDDVLIELYKGSLFHSVISISTDSDGLKGWDIPFTLESGSDYKIKISSVVNPALSDISDSNFTIVGNQVIVITPNGGEDWPIGGSQEIMWTDNLIDDVEIQLYKGGIFHSIVTSSTTSDGFYTWNISSSIESGTDYKIRIASDIDGSIFDFSDVDFTLSNDIVVNSPNGGEIWQAGTEQTITWNDNIPDEVLIELYKGSLFHSVISSSTDSDGLKEWDIPFTLESGSDYQVKISSVVDPDVSDISDSTFTIVGNQVMVTTPNGGEDWSIGSSQKIMWTDNFIENVEIQLYRGGIFHSIVTGSTVSDGLYTWNISSSIEAGTDYRIRIASKVDGNIFDFSDSAFTLSSKIVVTLPNGGEMWQAGISQDIEWDDNINDNVKIELYKGGIFDTEVTSSATSNGDFTWDIPVTIAEGSDYKIKITSVADSSINDFSDSDFTILAGNISVTSPNGGESWLAGSSQDITWNDNISSNVKIELYKSGVFYSEIISSATSNGSFAWDISDTTMEGSDYTVKISSVENSSVFDFSDVEFTIFAGNITVTSPNGGESWQAGSSQNITWFDNIEDDVTIDLYKGGSFHSVISTATSSDGSRVWDIPFTLESGSVYTVKITDVSNPSNFDLSDSSFAIVSNQITVTSPNGGENWMVESSQVITWADNIDGNVEIQLFKVGVFLTSISTSTASDGSFTWNIPNNLVQGSDYKLRISSVIDGSIFDFSDEDFTLSNEITVTAPNGSEMWQTGTNHNITWTDNLSGDVMIELFKAGVFDSEISVSTLSDGSFSWDIPDSTVDGLDYTIIITSLDNTSVFDFSDAVFEIYNVSITVVSPNGGESWQAGSSQNITWTDNIAGDVMIDLYKGGTFHSVISTSTGSDGSRNWEIPFTLESGTNYTVKITSLDNPSTLFDFSDADFTIVSNLITVTTPNGGEQWLDTEDQKITWTDNLTSGVEIQLFKNNVFHSSIVTSTPSDGEYTWNIPDNIASSADYKIKIISVDDGNINDISDEGFIIISNDLMVTLPNGGENWLTSTSQDITWTDDITGDVKIDLYKAEAFDSEITAAAPSDVSFTWNIPAGIATGSDYKIKITSFDQPVLFDMSDANFAIFTGGITVSSPNGAESWQAGSSQVITWADNITEDVTIDLYKGGVFHSIISISTESNGSKNWDIPFTLEQGANYTVKITSVDNPSTIFDFSDADFTIVGNQITVNSPNGGENWLDTEDQIITWTDNLIGSVEIQLFNSNIFHSSIVTSTPSDGEFTWDVPDNTPSASDYKIKILSVDDGNVSDVSDATFTIISSDLKITAPNGGENWLTSIPQDITWTDDISGDVKIELYKAEVFDIEISAATPSDGSFIWTVPGSVATSSDYKIKITSVDQPVLFDMSIANFTIFTGGISISSPNGGESYQAGGSHLVTWADNIAENVTIDLYKGGVFHSIISTSTMSNGSYDWFIPFDLESGNDYWIKITSEDNPSTIFDFSDSDFTIIANQITVTSPNGGENWQVESSQIITWMDNIEGNVEIQLFKGGFFLTSISTSASSNGTMEWDIPFDLEPGFDYEVRILSVDNQGTFDYSDANFTIVGNQITLTSPNNGESWMIGSQQIISWIDNLVGNVEIQLFKSGVFHSQIDNSTSSDNSFIWNISNTLEQGSDYKIKILSVNDGNIFDYSDEYFTLLSEIVVEVPNGEENWKAGTSQNVNWADNIVENVVIDLYKGGSFHSNISTSIESNGTRQWNVPFDLESGSDYSVKITSANNPDIHDFSDNYFTIEGKLITILSPSEGESWQAGTTQEIAWVDNFSENVKIALYKGDVFLSEIDPSNNSDGSKFWEIPFAMDSGSDYGIRMKSTDDPNPFDSSGENHFTIVANEIKDISPFGGEKWLIGSVQEIIWTDNLEGDVEILLYKGSILHTLISSSTASDGFFTWTVPKIEQGPDYKIKILSVVTAEVFSESDSNFIITSTIELNDRLSGVPSSFELYQNFPNPFNPSTTIYYGIPKESPVDIYIYDLLGNQVMHHSEDMQEAGYHKIEFNAIGLASGIYVYRIQSRLFVDTKKMLMIK